MKAVEGIGDEKDFRNPWKKWGLLLLPQGFVLFFEHQGGRTEVILDPSEVPRDNLTSA